MRVQVPCHLLCEVYGLRNSDIWGAPGAPRKLFDGEFQIEILVILKYQGQVVSVSVSMMFTLGPKQGIKVNRRAMKGAVKDQQMKAKHRELRYSGSSLLVRVIIYIACSALLIPTPAIPQPPSARVLVDPYRQIRLTCSRGTTPEALEDALLRLKPMRATIFKPHRSPEAKYYQAIIVQVEKDVADKILKEALNEKIFSSAELLNSSNDIKGHLLLDFGEERETAPDPDDDPSPDAFIELRATSIYDTLYLIAKKGAPHIGGWPLSEVSPQHLEQAIRKAGGILIRDSWIDAVGGRIAAADGHVIRVLIRLLSSPDFDLKQVSVTVREPNAIIATIRTDQDADTLARVVLSFYPDYIRVSDSVNNVRSVLIGVTGPRSLNESYQRASSEKAFLSVEKASLGNISRFDTLPSRWLNTANTSLSTCDQLRLYPQPDVNEGQVAESIKQVGGKLIEKKIDRSFVLQFPGIQGLVAGYFRAVYDKNIYNVTQNQPPVPPATYSSRSLD